MRPRPHQLMDENGNLHFEGKVTGLSVFEKGIVFIMSNYASTGLQRPGPCGKLTVLLVVLPELYISRVVYIF